MPLACSISDLRQRPEFFDSVADRIWRAWWEPNGHPFATITGRLEENMRDTPIPLALVAHHGSSFLGTASVIASDLDERPELTPWVAAVWVEESARGQGIGAALVDAAAHASFTLGLSARLSLRAGANDRLLRTARMDADRAPGRPASAQRIRPGSG